MIFNFVILNIYYMNFLIGGKLNEKSIIFINLRLVLGNY